MNGIRIINEENGKIECLCGDKADRNDRLQPGELGLEVVPCLKCGGVTFKTFEWFDDDYTTVTNGLILKGNIDAQIP